MKAEEFAHVELTNGLTGHVVEVFGDDEAYEFERDDAPYLEDSDKAWFVIKPDDIRAIMS